MSISYKSFLRRINRKYRLIISDETTSDELVLVRLSKKIMVTITAILLFLILILLFLLIAFTPLKQFVPGYPNKETRDKIEKNAFIADSLKKKMKENEKFFHSIKNIILGNDRANNQIDSTAITTVVDTKQIKFSRSASDSIFREKHEENEKYNLSVYKNKEQTGLPNILFYKPINGLITTRFNSQEKHFGIDISGNSNSRISAILDGTVIFADWTLDTGYVIQIQHSNNLISVYKHNAKLLKKAGEHVKSGEAIALLGNSGELSSGPHLHFEIWHNGVALNPESYIKF